MATIHTPTRLNSTDEGAPHGQDGQFATRRRRLPFWHVSRDQLSTLNPVVAAGGELIVDAGRTSGRTPSPPPEPVVDLSRESQTDNKSKGTDAAGQRGKSRTKKKPDDSVDETPRLAGKKEGIPLKAENSKQKSVHGANASLKEVGLSKGKTATSTGRSSHRPEKPSKSIQKPGAECNDSVNSRASPSIRKWREQSAPPQTPATIDGDTESEDDTVPSSRLWSRTVSAETSLTSVEESSTSTVTTATTAATAKLCWDFLNGKCTRRRCLYSHALIRGKDEDLTAQTPMEEEIIVAVMDSVKVKLGSGFDVKQVRTGFETRQMSSAVSLPLSLLQSVTFAIADEATEAVNALDGSTLFGATVSARLQHQKTKVVGGGTFHDGDVLFQLPTARTTAYVGYKTEKAASTAMTNAMKQDLRGMQVLAQRYNGVPQVGQFNVKYEFLPANATVKDLARWGEYEAAPMFERPSYQSSHNAVMALRRRLEEFGEVSVNVPPGKGRIFAHHYRSLLYTLSRGKFKLINQDLVELQAFLNSAYSTTISIDDKNPPPGPITIRLASENPSGIPNAKAAFDRILHGEKITENGQTVWNDFFESTAGVQFLADVEKEIPRVRINRDHRRRTLVLFGPEPFRSNARKAILARHRLLTAQRQRHYRLAWDLIGSFLSEDLASLKKELGDENVRFDSLTKELVVDGDEDAQKTAKLALQDATRRRGQAPRVSHSDGCPVCLNVPLTCLGDSARCTHRIPLSVVRQLLTPDGFDALARAAFDIYIRSRPKEFQYCPTPDCPQVYRVPGKRLAPPLKGKSRQDPPPPTPAPAPTLPPVLQCPSCLVRVCGACGAEHHESRSCQDTSPADEAQFVGWKSGHDVKDCPKCKVPIEREAGCNHMTCARCKTHICWACLETFETSGEVYGHMRAIHGGIGGLDAHL
ncbi:uncharacterized protein BXZ73DRAFT_75186 [Epithele typhae]|uniref:uncharacterized protein n=1 Tax=Epithele typhae TaxID=378194 RepID=UPI0020076E3C|nr:uncharacterized protein BXZ73DRAFT_75186 [Epithele typhae]KAH9941227.1 hypothetical protein BXZ73DRAFT_75186 [Epithele typhae]